MKKKSYDNDNDNDTDTDNLVNGLLRAFVLQQGFTCTSVKKPVKVKLAKLLIKV